MFKLTIIAIGSLKESYWKQACAEYIKRLSPFAKVSLIEVKEVPFNSQSDKARVSKKEAENILRAIPDDAFVITCEENGRQYDSAAFAKFLSHEGESGRSLVFILGGALGLHEDVRAKAHATLSLSPLTFTHHLARIVLLEQLYRAMTIISGKRYHY